MKKLSKEDKEDIGATIDQEGFDYYFEGYGADEKLAERIPEQIATYLRARSALVEAVKALGIDVE